MIMKSILKASHLTALVATCVFLTASAQAQSWLTNGLVAYYPFNGNANDAAGTNNGTVNGATLATNRFRTSNTAFFFNGTNYINIGPVVSRFDVMSMSAWISTTNTQTPEQAIVAKPQYGIPWTGSRLGVYNGSFDSGFSTISNQPYAAFGNVYVTNGLWHQGVFVNNGTNLQIFIDGNLASTVSHAVLVCTNSSDMLIGMEFTNLYGGTTRRNFFGIIDDVRIYNRALSSSEVSQLYAVESQLPTMNIASTTNGPAVFYASTNGSIYTIQMATNLASPVWATVTNGVPVYGLQITNPPPNAFFRVVN